MSSRVWCVANLHPRPIFNGMNKNLIVAKFIEKNGLKIVSILAVGVTLIVGLIFYFYVWQTITKASDSVSGSVNLKENLLEIVAKDLDVRSEKLDELKKNKINTRDIFK